jgi:hypothetical protein
MPVEKLTKTSVPGAQGAQHPNLGGSKGDAVMAEKVEFAGHAVAGGGRVVGCGGGQTRGQAVEGQGGGGQGGRWTVRTVEAATDDGPAP